MSWLELVDRALEASLVQQVLFVAAGALGVSAMALYVAVLVVRRERK